MTVGDKIDQAFEPVVRLLEQVFFWDPFAAFGLDLGTQVPIIVLWLVFGGIFFTIRLRFVNIRMFSHAWQLLTGRYDNQEDKGQVSHFQALSTALSATVGMGNIASVAIAVTVGGPGATFWMIVAGLLGMSLKFAECTLGVKYRHISPDGEVSGGPMYYLKQGLAKRGWRRAGIFLAGFYALMAVGASVGGSNMLQANQAFAQFSLVFQGAQGHGFWFGVVLAILIGVVVIGGIKSIARVSSLVVPFMAILYIGAAVIIIMVNIRNLGSAFGMILEGAFNAPAIKGGMIGVLITGFRRGVFSNEAGAGSAAIAHSAARVQHPVSEGLVSLLEPFIDTVIICTMTSLVLIFTGLYKNPDSLEGAQLTSAAFATVFSWFPYLLLVVILLFSFSTMVSWSYYGRKCFDYLFGNGFEKLTGNRIWASHTYHLLFLFCTVIGASSSLVTVLDFSDMMLLSLTFPNLIGLIIMSGEIRADLKEYRILKRNGVIRPLK